MTKFVYYPETIILFGFAESILLSPITGHGIKLKLTKEEFDQLPVTLQHKGVSLENFGFYIDANSQLRYNRLRPEKPPKRAILEIDSGISMQDLKVTLDKLFSSSVKFIQIRLFKDINPHVLEFVIESSKKFFNIEVLVQNIESIKGFEVIKSLPLNIKFLLVNPLADIKGVLDKTRSLQIKPYLGNLIIQNLDDMDLNSNNFYWFDKINLYLFNLIYIDLELNIRKSPYSIEVLGSFESVNLEHLFKNLAKSPDWKLSKNKIAMCRDCELRFCCKDPRIPEKIDNGIFSFDTYCSYNPYIAKWNTEKGYQTVAESIADGVVSEEFVYRPLD